MVHMMFGQGASTKSKMHDLYREQLVPKPLDEVFGFFSEALA